MLFSRVLGVLNVRVRVKVGSITLLHTECFVTFFHVLIFFKTKYSLSTSLISTVKTPREYQVYTARWKGRKTVR